MADISEEENPEKYEANHTGSRTGTTGKNTIVLQKCIASFRNYHVDQQ